jgi:citrate lyase subunit beta/citryl-CoA lyase
MGSTHWRSLLIAPAVRPDLVAKLPRSGPDAVIIDLEDGVPAAQKEEARVLAGAGVEVVARLDAELPIFVRVNPRWSGYLEPDIAALASQITGVVVPKASTPDDVAPVRAALDRRGLHGRLVIAGIETARGVDAAREICTSADAVYFGAEDFVADMGGRRTPSNQEVLYARSRVALAARLAGIEAIDQAVLAVSDLERVRVEGAEAQALGYGGKMCIHPAQVSVVNDAFTPTVAEVERSRRLIAAFEAAQTRGQGVTLFEGLMVDEPVARFAAALLRRANVRRVGLTSEEVRDRAQ